MYHSTVPDNLHTADGLTSAGDPLLDLAEALRPTLLSIAKRITGCPFHAEDVVQDVFLKLLPSSPSLPTDYSAGYLCRMVRNLAIDRSRRRALEDRLFTDIDMVDQKPANTGPTAESDMMGSETLHTIRQALLALSPRDRAIFTRHRLDGVAQKKLAEDFDLSPAAVCTIIKRVHAHCEQAVERSERSPLTAPPGS